MLAGLLAIPVFASEPTEQKLPLNPDLTRFEWIVPELPPVPPGMPPLPPATPVLRLKHLLPKRTPEEIHAAKEERVLARKRALAPWMSEEQLRAKPPLTEALVMAQRRASREFRHLGLMPKWNPLPATDRAAAPAKNAGSDSVNLLGGNLEPMDGGGVQPLDGPPPPQPRLELIDIEYFPSSDTTTYQLWITDAPLDQWFSLYWSPAVTGAPWYPVHYGQPEEGLGTSIQKYFVVLPGDPGTQGFFQAFAEVDSDGDGLLDGMEVTLFKSDPNDPDSAFLTDLDFDGQPDFSGQAVNFRADGDEDLDGDGLSNLKELQIGTNPFVAQSVVDTDADGIPDWAEELIFAYTGISNPGLHDDSDGDGVDNYTEIAVQTDPSYPDRVFWYDFSNLPDHRRAFVTTPITMARASANPSATISHIYDTAGTLGTYLHLEVRREENADGTPAPGKDTLFFGGSYLTPTSGYGMDLLVEGDSPSDGYIDTGSLMTIGTVLFADIWEEAKVSDAIDQLNLQKLLVIQQRSMLRTVIRMREMQLAIDWADQTFGTQLRLRTAISEIHTEMTLFRETSARIATFQGQNWASKAGFLVSSAGRVASVFSLVSSASDTYDAAQPFIVDVRRRCDNFGDTAADLAVALGNLASEFAPTFSAGNFWLIYWDQLSRFDGWDSFCF